MTLSGDLLIGGANVRGAASAFSATNPANGNTLEPNFAGATKEQVRAGRSFGVGRLSGLQGDIAQRSSPLPGSDRGRNSRPLATNSSCE